MSDNTFEILEDKDIILYNTVSYINNCIIYDSDIYKYIGFENYVMLSRKFPFYFQHFKDCDTKHEKIGFIPGNIFLNLDDNPEKIKKDLIKTIYCDKYISNTSNLIFENKNGNIEPIRDSDISSLWLFISIVMVMLFLISMYIIFTSPLFKEFIPIQQSSYKVRKIYYKSNT